MYVGMYKQRETFQQQRLEALLQHRAEGLGVGLRSHLGLQNVVLARILLQNGAVLDLRGAVASRSLEVIYPQLRKQENM